MPRTIPLLVLFSLPVSLYAQSPRFGERIEIKLIEIDVIVTDRDGKRVHGLTSGDFEILEGRSRQEITNFTEYRPPAESVTSTAQMGFPAAEPRTILMIADALPRAGLVRATAFENLQSLIPGLMRPGDRVGLVFWEPGTERANTVIEPSTDRSAVIAAVARLGGRSVVGTPLPDMGENEFFREAGEMAASKGLQMDVSGQEETTARFTAEIELMRFRRKTAAIRRIISTLAGGAGRKSLLYVSQDFGMPSGEDTRLSAITMLRELASAANSAGVTFYAVRPHVPDQDEGGLQELNRHLDALRRLTEPTGGLLDFGLPSVEKLGTAMSDDLQSYYSIAYRARSDGRDRERRVEVRTKNKDHRVRARQSFVEKSNETLAKETLIARLFSEQGGGDLRFEVEQGPPRRTSGNRWLLPITLKIPADQFQFETEGKDRVARVRILIVAGNGVAELTKITEDDLRVVAPKSKADDDGFLRYSVQIMADKRGSELSIGVFDRRTGLLGVQTIDNRGRFQ